MSKMSNTLCNTLCVVCGKRVASNKNLLTEHHDSLGKICYGSFMPIQGLKPFPLWNELSKKAETVDLSLMDGLI